MSSTVLIVIGALMLGMVYWIFKKGLKLFAFALILAAVVAIMAGVVQL